MQESLRGGGADVAADVRLAAAALLLPVGREAVLHVRGGADDGETNHRPQNTTAQTLEQEQEEDQDFTEEQQRGQDNEPELKTSKKRKKTQSQE